MESIYIETSSISYLRQRPSSHVVAAARQLLTHHWRNDERGNYSLVTSQFVVDEAMDGDATLAADRLLLLAEIPLLPLHSEITTIADEIIRRAILPPKASVDALHIAMTAYHRVDYLLTWNCTHIANGRILPRIHDVLTELGYPIPFVCTPEEMVNDD